MKTLSNTFALQPNDNRKSFYGKAIVKVYSDGSQILQSYLVNRNGDIYGFLRALKIDFVTGNDKNGGKESDFIQLTAKGKRQVKDIDFNLLLTL